eukprot:1391895-Pleurochrysis_carterae.AAC.2
MRVYACGRASVRASVRACVSPARLRRHGAPRSGGDDLVRGQREEEPLVRVHVDQHARRAHLSVLGARAAVVAPPRALAAQDEAPQLRGVHARVAKTHGGRGRARA